MSKEEFPSGYYDCCGMSRARGHANLCPKALRESIIHGLRSHGWSRIDAENEADDRLDIQEKRSDTE